MHAASKSLRSRLRKPMAGNLTLQCSDRYFTFSLKHTLTNGNQTRTQLFLLISLTTNRSYLNRNWRNVRQGLKSSLLKGLRTITINSYQKNSRRQRFNRNFRKLLKLKCGITSLILTFCQPFLWQSLSNSLNL
jgi:hypothetical protein